MTTEIAHIEQLMADSRYFEAHHMIESSLEATPRQERLEQLKALVLSKLGSHIDAMEYFEPLWRSHADAAESSGIMGGIYKSIFVANQDPKYGKLSARIYLENFQITKNYYTGINAATMSRLTGDSKVTKDIAIQLIDLLTSDERDYWQEASLAEAYLLIKEVDEATNHYIRAHELMGNNWSAIGSVQRQLWLLDHYIRVPKSIQDFFKPPVIAVFIGHMIDAPDREKPRFKPEMETSVRSAIRSSIQSQNIQIGYCSLACGADILFIEEMLDLNREVEIFLPFDKDDFIQTSVAFAGDHWVERFDNILKRLKKTEYLTKERFNGDAYHFHVLAEAMSGAAILRAKLLRSKPLLFAVLSEYSTEARTGGARDLINTWPDNNVHQVNIDLLKDILTDITTTSFSKFTGFTNSEEFNKRMSFIIAISDTDIDVSDYDTLLYHQKINDHEVIVFSSFYSVVRFIQKWTQSTSGSNGSAFNAGIKMSFITIIEGNISEETEISEAIDICDHSPKNTFLVDEVVAYRLALNSTDLEIKYAGELKTQESSKSNVYRVFGK